MNGRVESSSRASGSGNSGGIIGGGATATNRRNNNHHHRTTTAHSNGRASTATTTTTTARRAGGVGKNAFYKSSSSSSSSSPTAIVISFLTFLAVLYVGISSYAFFGMHHHIQQQQQQQQQQTSSMMIKTSSSTTRDSKSSILKSPSSTTTTTTTRRKTDTDDHHSSIRAAVRTDRATGTATGTGTAGISSSGAVSASTSSSTTTASVFPLEENVKAAERLLNNHDEQKIRNSNIITAYLEGPLHDTVPGTGNRGDVQHPDKKGGDHGTPPDLVLPLPLRTQSPSDLLVQEYPNRFKTCADGIPAKFPVDRGLELVKVKRTNPETNTTEEVLEPVVWNVGDAGTPPTFVEDELPYCPVEKDPFLPWIHDVFPSIDGMVIHFIAQNKRRCRTGIKFDEHVNRLVPQVTLMQGISVQRLDNESEAQRLAPQLWSPTPNTRTTSFSSTTPRYRLVPLDEADKPDGQFTRFICRFHTTDYRTSNNNNNDNKDNNNNNNRKVLLGETLSQFPFNYELAVYRKGSGAKFLTPRGKDAKYFWSSNLRFTCPVPKALQGMVASGTSLLSDTTPTLFVDVIPIRTSVRYEEVHMTEAMIGPKEQGWRRPAFNATLAWGNANVVPRVEASGRWENIPICLPPQVPPPAVDDDTDTSDKEKKEKEAVVAAAAVDVTNKDGNKKNTTEKMHYLSACLWASAEFKTRGLKTHATTDTLDRLQEWLEFHFLAGFDHVYVYDNSGAHSNTTNLKPLLSQYPASKVTWIDWPSIVCNNNIPAHDSTGERSSQYAAENSCRTRYAPFTTWIASFDTDEYFVPMGKHTSLRSMLHKAQDQGTNILSFRSSRGRLRRDKSYPTNDDIGFNDRRAQLPNATYLEAYNCDSAGSPKPEWAERARKQIYQADYVLYHYVHYSTVTKGHLVTYQDHIDAGRPARTWSANYGEHRPSERTVDEINEAVLVHTKTIKPETTGGWMTRCKFDYEKKWKGCWVAFPWPNTKTNMDNMISVPRTEEKNRHDADGYEYNCFINEKVEQYWVPRLRAALDKRKKDTAANAIASVAR